MTLQYGDIVSADDKLWTVTGVFKTNRDEDFINCVGYGDNQQQTGGHATAFKKVYTVDGRPMIMRPDIGPWFM